MDLLLDYKCTFKSEDQKGVSPLGAAAAASCAEAVEMLLDVGAPVDASAVFGALNAESRECEALLLDASACPSATNSDGRTAMHIAAFTGYYLFIVHAAPPCPTTYCAVLTATILP